MYITRRLRYPSLDFPGFRDRSPTAPKLDAAPDARGPVQRGLDPAQPCADATTGPRGSLARRTLPCPRNGAVCPGSIDRVTHPLRLVRSLNGEAECRRIDPVPWPSRGLCSPTALLPPGVPA